MCEIAKKLGFCIEGVEGAVHGNGFCGKFSQQAECGNLVNQDISDERISPKAFNKNGQVPKADGAVDPSKHKSPK